MISGCIKAIHGMNGGSAGKWTIADIATINAFKLSRYHVSKLAVKIKLESCQLLQHEYNEVVMNIFKS